MNGDETTSIRTPVPANAGQIAQFLVGEFSDKKPVGRRHRRSESPTGGVSRGLVAEQGLVLAKRGDGADPVRVID